MEKRREVSGSTDHNSNQRNIRGCRGQAEECNQTTFLCGNVLLSGATMCATGQHLSLCLWPSRNLLWVWKRRNREGSFTVSLANTSLLDAHWWIMAFFHHKQSVSHKRSPHGIHSTHKIAKQKSRFLLNSEPLSVLAQGVLKLLTAGKDDWWTRTTPLSRLLSASVAQVAANNCNSLQRTASLSCCLHSTEEQASTWISFSIFVVPPPPRICLNQINTLEQTEPAHVQCKAGEEDAANKSVQI